MIASTVLICGTGQRLRCERRQRQLCKESRSPGLFSGKPSYGKTPFPDSKSTSWEFFTDDYVRHQQESSQVP